MQTRRKGYSLMEMIVVVAIIIILGSASIIVGGKQVAKSRIQEATSFVQTMENNLEEGITEIGFLQKNTVLPNDSGEIDTTGITAYLNELEDVYLNCILDYSKLEPVAISPGFGGFKIGIASPLDPWEETYTMFYFFNEATDRYRIVIVSPGPNNILGDGYTNGYVTIGNTTANADDDIIDILISR